MTGSARGEPRSSAEGWSTEGGRFRRRAPAPGAPPLIVRELPTDGGPDDRATRVARLENERAIAQLLPPNIALIPLELTTTGEAASLTYEDFPGGRPLGGEPLTVDEFLARAIPIADAVAEMHQAGILHRDLKPENVLFDPASGQVRLTGFDFAVKLTADQAPPLATLEASLPYLSPEQTGRTGNPVDHRSDLYALGITFYQLLAGRLPFDASDPLEWIHSHIARVPERLSVVVPSVPEALAQIVAKLLAKEAGARYQSARGLRHDLAAVAAARRDRDAAALPLGTRDVADRLEIPHKLYGQDRAVRELCAAVERTLTTGRAGLTVVVGPPGAGKSSVVAEARGPVRRAGGSFVSGKFDQIKRSSPYAALAAAMRDRLYELLSGSDAEVAEWRDRVRAGVSAYGRALVDMLPALELLIGPQAPLPELPPAEAQARLNAGFRTLTAIFASAAHPLVVFIDDAQWADAGSLALLGHAIAHPATRHVHAVVAHRDEGIPPDHPVRRLVAEVHASGADVRTITLEALSAEDIAQLLADATRSAPPAVTALARLVHERTAGNPLFTLHFLTTLDRERLIRFDDRAAEWRADLDRVKGKAFSANVVDLLVYKLLRLEPRVIETLKVGACLGSKFETDTLTTLLASPIEDVTRALGAAAREGLVALDGAECRFVHDRVQQAAYSLLSDREAVDIHLRAGRLLKGRLVEHGAIEDVCAAVDQLDQVADHVTDPGERLELARLNLAASRWAKSAAAFGNARAYAATGEGLLPSEAWGEHHGLAFALALIHAEGDLLNGALADAERRATDVATRAATRSEKARVQRLLVDLYTRRGETQRAISCAQDCMRLFGLELPAIPSPEQLRDAEQGLERRLAGRPIERLGELPLLQDPDVEAAIDVLGMLLPTAYFSAGDLHRLVALTLVSLTLDYGVAPSSPTGFGALGMELCATADRIPDAHRFALAAREMVERHGFLASEGPLLGVIASSSQAHNRHLKTSVPLLEKACQSGVDAGDLLFASFAALWLTATHLIAGSPLSDVIARGEAAMGVLARAGYEPMLPLHASLLNFARALSARAGDGTFTLTGPHLDEETFERELEPTVLPVVAFIYWLMKLQARYYAGDFEGAARAARRGVALSRHHRGQITVPEVHVFAALALAAALPGAPPEDRAQMLDEVREHRDWLALRAAHCPENFGCRLALIGAELDRLEGNTLAAEEGYDRAATLSHEHGFVQFEAIALERAADLRARGHQQWTARTTLAEAHAAYLRWGANAKARLLEREHPLLAQAGHAAPRPLRAEELDLRSVLKASQTISGELELDRLTETLLRLVMEHGGATRGVILIAGDDSVLRVEAEAAVDRGTSPRPQAESRAERPTPEARTEQRAADATARAVPWSVVHFVERTREHVILDDARATTGHFRDDPYFASSLTLGPVVRGPVAPSAQPVHLESAEPPPGGAPTRGGVGRSVLCLPIVRQSAVMGVLYLENTVLAGAFTGERLATLEILAAQAAIAVDNARLYRQQQQAVDARNVFLAVASHELRTPLTALLLRLEALLRKVRSGPDDRLSAPLAAAGAQARRLSDLVDQLLDVSRLSAERLALVREWLDLGELVRAVMDSLRDVLARAGCDVALDVEGDARGHWDRSRLEQAITNLVGNAVKFGPGAPIRVQVRGEPGRVRLAVRDHGIGLAEHDRQRVFDKFARGVSEQHYGGLGLGLYVTKEIVEAHGGTIGIAPTEGPGTTFTLSLPREAAHD